MISDIGFENSEKIKSLQIKLLKKQLNYLNTHSNYYKRLFEIHKIQLKNIKTIADLATIPLTSKFDLQQFNEEFICVKKHEIIDFSSTSGTTSKPINFYLNEADLQRLAFNEAISFSCAGIKKGDVVQLMATMDRKFMAGLAYFLGVRKIGAGIVRTGAGAPEFQWESILTHKPKFLITVPSFLLKLIKYAEDNNIDIASTSPKAAICIGEPLSNQDFSPLELHKRIKEKWNIELFSTYASTEMSTAFTECQFHKGGHEQANLIITEIIDENNNVILDGSPGELVITTLGVQSMPLLRYKTGDIVRKHTEICECGRHSSRIGPLIGRNQQMIKYKGTTIFPQNIQDVLNSYKEIKGYVIELNKNELGLDDVCVKINCTEQSSIFEDELKNKFKSKIRVTPKIEYINNDELAKIILSDESRKPKVVIDLR
jgi:phenylacetate-CoA ligase